MYQALLDATPYTIWIYRSDGVTLEYVNAVFERVFRIPRATLDGAPLAWVERLHQEDRAEVRAELAARCGRREPRAFGRIRLVRPDGEVRWLRTSV